MATSTTTTTTANGLRLLMGDYSSGSETDEDAANCPSSPERDNNSRGSSRSKTTKASSEPAPTAASVNVNEAVDAFVSELEAVSAAPAAAVDSPSQVTEDLAAAPVFTSWTQCIDKATGHPYYWHPDTKEVTWEMPAEYQLFLDTNAEQLASCRMADMWTVCYTEDAGGDEPQRYYVNEFTRMVSWDKPIGFVEPAEAAPKKKPSNEPAPRKNVIKRRRKVASPKPAKRENPYAKPSAEEQVKIELISSFATKSDSSEDEEEGEGGDKLKTLKLVATDYNSDTDQNTSALDTSGVLCAIVPTKPSKKVAELPPPSLEVAPVNSGSDSDNKPTKKVKSTFASIITGGRSPEQKPVEATEATDSAGAEQQPELARRSDDYASVKMQKRKRRIEFITKAPAAEEVEEEPQIKEVKVATAAAAEQAPSAKDAYANFKRGQVEFVDPKKTVVDDSEPKPANSRSVSKSPPPPATVSTVPTEASSLADQKDLIEAKLRFLSDGRADPDPVLAIQIQLETLVEAHDEGALQTAYFSRWLDAIGGDLRTLEAGAAPSGWLCVWNRVKAQYCYVHQSSGTVSWEYPSASTKLDDVCEDIDSEESKESAVAPEAVVVVAGPSLERPANDEEDAMDICTTPPPPMVAGPREPPPPGTSDDVASELASFYSDLAAIESTTTTASDEQAGTSSATPQVTSAADSAALSGDDAAAAAAKKPPTATKKRKAKKLQPWRSGNLETWINKWAKAQQELEN